MDDGYMFEQLYILTVYCEPRIPLRQTSGPFLGGLICENEAAKKIHHPFFPKEIPHYLPRRDGQYSSHVILAYVLSSSTSMGLHAAAEMEKHQAAWEQWERYLDSSNASGVSVCVCLQLCQCYRIKGKFSQIQISAWAEKAINILLSFRSYAIKIESIPLQIKMRR